MYQNQPSQRPEYVGLSHVKLHAMKEKPGVLVIGKRNLGQKDVLENIETFLDEFYDVNDLAFMMLQPERFPLRENMKIPAVALEQKSQEEVATNANINIVYYGNTQSLNPRDKDADYSVARSFSEYEKFGVYFYLKDEKGNFDSEASMKQRDDFLESLRAKQPGQTRLL